MCSWSKLFFRELKSNIGFDSSDLMMTYQRLILSTSNVFVIFDARHKEENSPSLLNRRANLTVKSSSISDLGQIIVHHVYIFLLVVCSFDETRWWGVGLSANRRKSTIIVATSAITTVVNCNSFLAFCTHEYRKQNS